MPEIDSEHVQPGTVIEDRYEVLRLIGEGQKTAVYLAKNKFVGKQVAIKMLRNCQDSILVQRFQHEAKCLSTINHPNVVSACDFGVTAAGAAFIVMEFIDGESLAVMLKRDGVLPLKRFRDLFGQACEALSAVHACRIVHRDVKPSNFLISDSGTSTESLTLIDFAVCKLLPAEAVKLSQMGEIVGTPFYMSPEQCMGKEVDHRSDIYSLGCCMYEALCGFPPLQGKTMVDTMSKHISDQPPSVVASNPDLASVEYVVTRCLEKKPEDRFQSMTELKHALCGDPVKHKPSDWLRKIFNP